MKSCYDCVFAREMTPLVKDLDVNIVCDHYKHKDKWLICFPTLRALFCKQYMNYEMRKDCFQHCKKFGSTSCPPSFACLAWPNRPFFEAKDR